MDHGGEALIGFVGAYGDAFELFELAEEGLDEVAPFVYLGVDWEGFGLDLSQESCASGL
jgi:hypothetical protein